MTFSNAGGGRMPNRCRAPQRGESRDALDQKGAGLEKRNPHGDFEGRATQAGGVRHNRDQRAVPVAAGHADTQRGPGFAGQAEIDQPDLTAL